MTLEIPEKREAPDARTSYGGSSDNQPLFKPSLRSFQRLKEKPHRKTVARALRPFGRSEAQVTVLEKNGFPAIRLSIIEGTGLDRFLDLRKSDIRAVINGLHTALAELGGR